MESPLRAQPPRAGWSLQRYTEERHVAQHRQVLADTFACSPEEADRWIAVAGAEKFRVLEHDGDYAATSVLMPMRQSIGGRFVGTRGVAGVGVRPAYRRGGIGALLMAECLREMEAAGDPLSILYASTTKLYRGVGYDLAGMHFAATYETAYLPAIRTELQVRELTNADRPAMQAIADANARWLPGHMSRCDYLWPRLLRPRGKPAQQLGVFTDDGTLKGFVSFALNHEPEMDDWQSMNLFVLEAADTEGLHGLVAVLRSHHSMVRRIDLTLPPQHPLWSWLPEQRTQFKMREQFLIRVVRVADALAARGFLPLLQGELVLELTDPVLPANEGHWHLRVQCGRASIESVGPEGSPGVPRVAMDIGAFASLYAGHHSAEALHQIGRARGDADALAAASALFASRAVSCPEMF